MAVDYIAAIEAAQVRKDLPKVIVGDNVRVHYRIREGEREREQVFQGDVIRMSGAGARETFTVRKLSFGVGVERTFPVHSPKIAKLEVVRHGQRSPAAAAFAVRSCTTCAIAWARLLASARSASSARLPEPSPWGWLFFLCDGDTLPNHGGSSSRLHSIVRS